MIIAYRGKVLIVFLVYREKLFIIVYRGKVLTTI